MPGCNASGPLGQGPMTGRGFGPCNAYGAGYKRNRGNMFRGFTAGRRSGYRGVGPSEYFDSYTGPASQQEQLSSLKDQRDYLNECISELEKTVDDQ